MGRLQRHPRPLGPAPLRPRSLLLPPPQLGALLLLYIAAVLYITGVWALFEEQPAYVFTFPSNVNDAIFHLATAGVFSAVAAVQLREDRSVIA